MELTKVPVYGACVRKCESISIDRSAGAAGLRKMVADSKRAMAQGRYLVIFPEGTRTDPGQSATYHSGVGALYKQLNVPVLPVALNSGNFWGRYQWIKSPGEIVVKFLEPIPPGEHPRQVVRQVEERIEAACAALPNPKVEAKIRDEKSTTVPDDKT